jgi:hypothetical protein
MEKLQQQQPQIDLSLTTAVTSSEGKHLFSEGIIIRKISKFVINSHEDGLIPLPVFYDVSTGKILLDSIPKEIREDYKDIGFSLEK